MTDDQVQELKRYKELLDVGALSQADYDRLKERAIQVELIALSVEGKNNPQKVRESRNAAEQKKHPKRHWGRYLLELLLLVIVCAGGYYWWQYDQTQAQNQIKQNEQHAVKRNQKAEKANHKPTKPKTQAQEKDETAQTSSATPVADNVAVIDGNAAQALVEQNDPLGGGQWMLNSSDGTNFTFVTPADADGTFQKALVTDRGDGQNVELRMGTVDTNGAWQVDSDVTIPWQ
ncbi:hypothetical protein IV73_GL000539 [Weissella kandleri]|uniref:SHOCT domain-containing protein n=1 Tax=Weissella kandleri TaxID=1616 RepID=A0A0R2JDE7_9LACO|nr:hypothetical protein [Weissella kandleri]KRN75374.1 hypothetical protein IV73_GL000539 [Weissella kandleri]